MFLLVETVFAVSTYTTSNNLPSDILKKRGNYCTMNGYDMCYENSNEKTYHCALAVSRSKLGYSTYGKLETMKAGNIIRSAKVKYKCEGDRAYYLIGSQMSCNVNGCSGNRLPNLSGEVTVISAPSEVIPPIHVVCWDYDYDECDSSNPDDPYWADSATDTGWFTAQSNIKVIKCYEDNDCQAGAYCDKRSGWETWECKNDPCRNTICEDRCINWISYKNGKCESPSGEPVCKYDELMCEYGCKDNKLCKGNPCIGIDVADKCEGGVIMQGGSCIPKNNGDYTVNYQINIPCEFGCSGLTCRNDPCIGIDIKDKCEGNTSLSKGSCIPNLDGTYNIQYDSEELCENGCTDAKCNPDHFPITNIVIVIMIVSISILLFMIIRKK